ncbi:hypothetical protein F3Y22_tig00110258pilonHSYRG00029 [Hibiscus syriacus]|uniref:Uncharacterized protein n=2 Tax=Hibiscus syriacus TaxID=106335 RepID=A0A6A3B8L9_HIBSY|nr:hypothetical protein F3Y22_tig00110258pilonHSYRG00029 [Hibiscus syriacus]
MHALLRAQTSVRSQRIRRSFNKENLYCLENRNERFDEPRSEIHSNRLFASMETNACDDSPKIVEVDTLKTRSRSRRFNLNALSKCGDELPYQTTSSLLPCAVRSSTPNHKNVHDFEWRSADKEFKFSTAQTTPRFGNTTGISTLGKERRLRKRSESMHRKLAR